MSSIVSREDFKKNLIDIIDSTVAQDPKVLRFKDMLLDSSNYGNYPTKPGPMTFEIKDYGEKAFQRGLLLSQTTLLDYKGVKGFETAEWLDGELPIVLTNKGRRPCIDLIGSLDGIPILCELKYSYKGFGDSPEYAVIELLTYYCLIQFNALALDVSNVHHTSGKPFQWEWITNNGFPELIVCANKIYWSKWFKQKRDRITLTKKVFDWSKTLDTNIHLFQSEDFNFKSQKGVGKYTPSIPINGIWEII